MVLVSRDGDRDRAGLRRAAPPARGTPHAECAGFFGFDLASSRSAAATVSTVVDNVACEAEDDAPSEFRVYRPFAIQRSPVELQPGADEVQRIARPRQHSARRASREEQQA